MPKITGQRSGTQGSLPLYAIGAPRAVLPGPPSVRHFQKPQYGRPPPVPRRKRPSGRLPAISRPGSVREAPGIPASPLKNSLFSDRSALPSAPKDARLQAAHGFGTGENPFFPAIPSPEPAAGSLLFSAGQVQPRSRKGSRPSGQTLPQWEPVRLLQSPMPTVISASFVLSGESVIYSRFARNRIPAYSSLFRSAAGMLL